ncbi:MULTISPECIES: SCO2322 family protein [unclassified Streptomyces]|uniref:SCO2322 family protein n=1 Tax=unclassified Streptomyces TaxID=2593676 RepID=UPI002DD7DE3B|nr:SCO2322 family protein [Streptomyces sp. NBC_01445]WSE07481.1 SCO2322 family protein [Streptomyces sp. NBC_01445]
MTTYRRRSLAVLISGVLCALVAGAGQAQATGYRYWSFWDRDGSAWVYASQGPSTARPSDGDVQGFRFSVSEDSQDSAKPRGAASFDAICADTPAKGGEKRVALVVDFGTAQDAPSGETPPKARTACARVADDATSAEALAAVAKPLRYNNQALLCSIAGFPKTGCGEQVSSSKGTSEGTEPGTSKDAASDGGGPSVGLIAGGAAVVVLGAAAAWQARRRRG